MPLPSDLPDLDPYADEPLVTKGIVAGVCLSVPLWVGIGLIGWWAWNEFL